MLALLLSIGLTLMAVQDRFLLLGDSIMDYKDPPAAVQSAHEGWWYDRQHYPGASDFRLDVIGSADPSLSFGDAWFVGQSRVAGFENSAVSGTKYIGNWDQAGATRTQAQNFYSDNGSPTIRAVLCILGANDVISGSTVSTATYVTAIASLKSWITSTFTGSPQLYIGLISQASTGTAYVLRTNRVRQALLDAETAGHCVLGWNGTGQAYADDVHYDTNAQRSEIGYGFYLAMMGTPAPRVSSVTINGGRTIVTVSVDRPLSNSLSSSVGGFSVTDDGSAATVSSQIVASATTIELTLSGAITAGHVVAASFADGRNAVGQTVPLGAAQSVNATTYSHPLVPFFDVTATTAAGSAAMFASVVR